MASPRSSVRHYEVKAPISLVVSVLFAFLLSVIACQQVITTPTATSISETTSPFTATHSNTRTNSYSHCDCYTYACTCKHSYCYYPSSTDSNGYTLVLVSVDTDDDSGDFRVASGNTAIPLDWIGTIRPDERTRLRGGLAMLLMGHC